MKRFTLLLVLMCSAFLTFGQKLMDVVAEVVDVFVA